MAEPVRMSGCDIAIVPAVFAVASVIVFQAAGAVHAPAASLLPTALAAVAGAVVWFAILQRRRA